MPPSAKTVRVVCLSPYPDDGPSVRHRVALYGPLWAEQGVRLHLFAFATRRLYKIRRRFGWRWTLEKALWMAFCTVRLALRLPLLARYDVVIIHREVFPLGPMVFERLAAWMNPRIVFDFDDAIWTPPSNSVNQRAFLWNSRRVPGVIARARHVVAGNRFLGDYARRHNSCVTIIPTPYEDLPPKAARGSATLPVVVWIGNLGNAWYVGERMRALERAAAVAPFVLRLIGGDDLAEIRSDVLQIDRRPWSAAEEHALGEADIGIMPVPDLDYEKGKCGFKIVQYWSAGIAVIASPVGVNATMISHGRDGFLAETDDEWERALVACLSDEGLRAEIAAAGRGTFVAKYTRSIAAAAWSQVFSRMLSAEAA